MGRCSDLNRGLCVFYTVTTKILDFAPSALEFPPQPSTEEEL